MSEKKKRNRERGNGEGTVFKLSGNRKKPWAVRITVGWDRKTGKQLMKYLSYHRTRKEAKAALREYLVNPFNLESKDITVMDMFEEWYKTTPLELETKRGYKSALNQVPAIHNRKLRDIKIVELKAYMKDLRPATQANFKYMMKHVYMLGIENEAVERDLSVFLKPESGEKKQRKPFSLEEIAKIKEFDHELKDITIILLYTGMRISEILEMKRENVNLEERYLYGGKKTETGKTRITPIHDAILPIVERYYAKGTSRLITDRKGKPVSYQVYLTNYWYKLRGYLETDHTPHSTRHTFVTFARRCGLDRDLVKKIVGHSNKDVTDIYDHSDIEELLEEVNKLSYDVL